jgi:ATP-dependent DNA ligase
MKTERPVYRDLTTLFSDDTQQFHQKLRKIVPQDCQSISIMPKYDGQWGTLVHELGDDTIRLWSRHGKLKKEWTRTIYDALPSFRLYGEYIFGTQYAQTSPYSGAFLGFDADFYDEEDISSEPFILRHNCMKEVLKPLGKLSRGEIDAQAIASDNYALDEVDAINKVIHRRLAIGDSFDNSIEGVVIKPLKGTLHTPWVRIKPIFTMDYVIMGFNQSDAPKYKGKMVRSIRAGLWIEGTLTHLCDVSGLNEADRKRFYEKPNLYVGKVIECSGKEIFNSGALRHPNFVRFHPEKLPEDCILTKD